MYSTASQPAMLCTCLAWDYCGITAANCIVSYTNIRKMQMNIHEYIVQDLSDHEICVTEKDK